MILWYNNTFDLLYTIAALLWDDPNRMFDTLDYQALREWNEEFRNEKEE